MTTNPPKTYKTRLTSKALFLGSIPLICAALLGHFALDAAHKFSPADASRYIFIGLPAVIAAGIVLTLLAVCYHFLNREITLNGSELQYRDSKGVMHLAMTEMAYSPPAEGAVLRTLMFSDGATFVQIPEIFLGTEQFEDLIKHIKRHRRERDFSEQKTYSL